MRYVVGFIILLLIIGVWYCVSSISMLSPGTHGSLKAYEYPVTKHELETAVDSVLANSSNVRRVISYYYYSYDSANNSSTESLDSDRVCVKVFDSAYNDGKRYLQLNIFAGNDTFDYTMQYAGDEFDWDTSKNSDISIAYAWDGKGNGGSEGNGGFNGKWGLKEKMINLFESEFINKVDKRLQKAHTTSN